LIGRILKDTVNLLIYGGGFIGLCAACMTALTFELTGQDDNHLQYVLLIGTATAALYSMHRVIGLQKSALMMTTDRFAVIRKYQFHIRVYAVLWIILSIWLVQPLWDIRFVAWLIPGGTIALAYVIPFMSGGRRLRDLGWGKILMIGWSWSWLTAVLPMWYFAHASIQMTIIHGIERLCFIMLITIPFEIRDIKLDRSLGLITMPEKLGNRRTRRIAIYLGIVTVLLSFIGSLHYFNTPYGLAMTTICLIVIPLVGFSYKTNDDYFFSGLMDGTMILALWLFLFFHQLL